MKRPIPYFILIFSILTLFGAGCSLRGQRQSTVQPPPANIQTPTSTAQLDTADTSDWLTYKNDEYGFSFKYPRGWDNSKIFEFMTDGKQENSEEMNANFSKDTLSQLARESVSVSYYDTSDKPVVLCQKASGCSVAVNLLKFDEKTPLELLSYEGSYDFNNLIEERVYVSEHSNAMVGDRKALLKDSYFIPGDSFTREYTFFINDYRVKVSASVSGGKFGRLNGSETTKSYWNMLDLNLDQIIKDNPNDENALDIKKLLESAAALVSSLQFY